MTAGADQVASVAPPVVRADHEVILSANQLTKRFGGLVAVNDVTYDVRKGEIFAIIQTINASGTTVLLIEQNARKALTIAQRGYVIETGNIVLADASSALLNSEQVRRAYLGE